MSCFTVSELVGEGPLSYEQRYQLAALLATIAGSLRTISGLERPEPAEVVSCWEPVEAEYRERLAVMG
jgi:membrane protein YdbS with pleckstrin-like domain